MPLETAGRLLAAARGRLKAAGIATAALDARLLLQHAAGLSHAQLVADPDLTVEERAAARFESFIRRRLAHEPVSRILGEREFHGRIFMVTPDVLDPRPDTEALIEEALPRLKPGMRVLDLGAGSGAVIVTLLAERAGVTGVAVDVSPAALSVTMENARRLGVADRLTAVEGSWYDAVAGRFDVIVSNPPYIAAADIAGLAAEVRNFDPHLALAGGADGLAAYRAIAAGAAAHLTPGGLVVVEVGAGQSEDVAAIFRARGLALAASRADLGGHTRALVFAPG